MSGPTPGTYQFVWWWRWKSLWPPMRWPGVPMPDHGPACPHTGVVYEYRARRIGPLEIRKWGREYHGDPCTCHDDDEPHGEP
jgi:hypothetical protein